ncbi:MAG TPA: MazG-like family protein [bacterium]|nr:MazG-like family protein [bacterium]
MNIQELTFFIKWEHERLLKMYGLKNHKELRHLIALKTMEELGELSEELLALDSIQRKEKLENKESKVGDEITDVIITAMLLAENLGVDIESHLQIGIEKRKNRKY